MRPFFGEESHFRSVMKVRVTVVLVKKCFLSALIEPRWITEVRANSDVAPKTRLRILWVERRVTAQSVWMPLDSQGGGVGAFPNLYGT